MEHAIRLLTYNIFIRPPGINTNGDDFKYERLRDIIDKVIPEYDIVCLQELFDAFSDRKERFLDCVYQQGFHYSYSIDRNLLSLPFFPIDGGITIISRYPITRASCVYYNRGKHADALSQKGAIYCQIKINANLLDLYNTHLQSINKYQPIRRHQLNTFREFFCQTHHLSIPAVVCGDFNIPYSHKCHYTQLLHGLQFPGIETINILEQQYGADTINMSTYGSGEETCLTDERYVKSKELIDYIWIMNTTKQPATHLQAYNTTIEKFKVTSHN